MFGIILVLIKFYGFPVKKGIKDPNQILPMCRLLIFTVCSCLGRLIYSFKDFFYPTLPSNCHQCFTYSYIENML